MKLSQVDYYRDGVAMALADGLTYQEIWAENALAENGEQFNIAIWATSKLRDIMDTHGRR